MFKNYKVIVNTAAGRRRYLKLLIPQVLQSDIVDQYDLWVNTTDKLDIAFLEQVAKKYPKVNLIWQPDNVINGVASIDAFYKYCQDDNTIYIKLDDDVVWIAPNFFEEIVSFRIANPQYFLVSPLVINNDISTYILQNEGLLKLTEYYPCMCYNIRNYNGYFALQLHDWFLNNYLKTNNYSELYCGKFEIGLNRFAINAVAWFGEDFKKFNAVVPGDDEEFLTVKYPAHIHKLNCFDCATVISHFSFSQQRMILDKSYVLDQYEDIIKHENSGKLRDLMHGVYEILDYIEKEKKLILSRPLPRPYVQVKVNQNKKYNMLLGLFGIHPSLRNSLMSIVSKVKHANRLYIAKL